MNTQEQAPKSVEGMLATMRDSTKFLDSRLGFIGDQYLYQDGKEVVEMLQEVKEFIQSEKAKEYFNQSYDYAVLFDESLTALKFKAESAETLNGKDPANNTALKEAREILEDLSVRVKTAQAA